MPSVRASLRFATALAVFCAPMLLLGCEREAPTPTEPAPAAAQPPPVDTSKDIAAVDVDGARRIRADVTYLADDKLEGREAGTRGYDLAADYVAKRFREIGLVPAGENGGFFQTVPLLKATRAADGALTVKRNGREIALRAREQFLPGLNYDAPEHALEAPAVFVGQAVHAPELRHDDFAGLDLTGKIAVVFPGAPARFDHDRRAFYSSTREKLRALVERGAIGAVIVNTPEDEADAPWAHSAAQWDKAGMRLRDAEGRGVGTFPELRATATVSAAAADLIFADGARTAAELFAAAREGKLKGFALPGTLALSGRTRIEPVMSRNVVAALPGGDAALSKEYVAYSAHLDHLGIGAPVDGDAIYNGALDNALGVAILLEAATQLRAQADAQDGPPKRSMLFVAVTAEEKGLLGAEWFATHPTVPADGIVANLNVDMPVLLAPSKDTVPIGVEHSSLKATLDAAAQDIGIALSPDPFPEEAIFVRSDQYAFIRAGVPAVYLTGGMVSADGQRDPKLALRKFLRDHYHRPSDDANLPIAYGDASRLARLNARIGRLVGDAAQRPAWNPGDFFGERFGK
ncbi:MAG: M28 family peptidase [Lysobacter sp.]|nr:MAG: M28 family peptidase [Lysobacter sp.]